MPEDVPTAMTGVIMAWVLSPDPYPACTHRIHTFLSTSNSIQTQTTPLRMQYAVT